MRELSGRMDRNSLELGGIYTQKFIKLKQNLITLPYANYTSFKGKKRKRGKQKKKSPRAISDLYAE